MLPAVVSEILVAILLGLVVSNVWKLPTATGPGLRFVVQRVLRAGIVLLGARFYLADVAPDRRRRHRPHPALHDRGAAFALLVGRRFKLPPRLALLIGVGTAVCGNSAIVATAPGDQGRRAGGRVCGRHHHVHRHDGAVPVSR